MSGRCWSICSHDTMWWLQCCFWKSQRLSGLWSCCHLPWELCLTGVTFPGVLCSGCLAPSPSWSSRLHLAETRWFLVLPHWPYWLPVYLPSSCVFLSYCSMSFLWSWCRFSRLLYSWIVSSWPWQMETECFHPQGSCLFFFSFQFFSDFWPRWRSRGTEARNISKVLRSAIVVVHIMNVLCRALSFLPLLVIWRAESNILDLVLITT